MKGFFSRSPFSRQASQKEMSSRGWGREMDGPVSDPLFVKAPESASGGGNVSQQQARCEASMITPSQSFPKAINDNVGIAISNHPFLMVHTTHLW